MNRRMKTVCDFCKTEYSLDAVPKMPVKCAVCGNVWTVQSPVRRNTFLTFIAALCALLAAAVFAIAVIAEHQIKQVQEKPLVAEITEINTVVDEKGEVKEETSAEVEVIGKGKEEECEAMRQKFIVPESDHLTMLNVFNQWKNVGETCETQLERDQERAIWAKRHYLHNMSLCKAAEIRRQLEDIAREEGMEISSVGPSQWDVVRKCICSAYFHHCAHLKNLSEYYNIQTGIQCYIHPSSSLSGHSFIPEYIVYHELVLTTKHYLHCVTAIDPLWLSQMAPEFFTATDVFGKILEEGKPQPIDLELETQEWIQEDSKETKINDSRVSSLKTHSDAPPIIKANQNDPLRQKLPPIHDDTGLDSIILPPSLVKPKKRKKMF